MFDRSSFRFAVLVFVPLFFCTLNSHTLAQTTEVVIFDGDDANGNGVFDFLSIPEVVIGNAGFATTMAELDQTNGGLSDDFGIFQTDGNTMIEIVRQGDPSPDGNGLFRFNFDNVPLVNRFGQVTFNNTLNQTAGGTSDDRGIFLADGTTVLKILREGDLEPGGDGTFNSFANFAMNNVGQVAVDVSLLNTPASRDDAIYLGDGQTLIKIAREDDSVPNGNSNTRILSVTEPALNDLGQVAFQAFTLSGNRIFVGDGTNIVEIASVDDTIPGGDEEFANFTGGISINNHGQVAFTASLSFGTANTGLFIGDGQSMSTLLLEDDPAPDGFGTFANLHGIDEPLINEAGQVLLITDIDNGSIDEGIFRFDGAEDIQIAREDYPVPVGVGNFRRFEHRSFNNRGQVAFLADLSDTMGSLDDTAIYFYDDVHGLLQVAREGDSLAGGTIRELTFTGNYTEIGSRNGLNDAGQVAFGFRLTDFTIGVAVWTPPGNEFEPNELTVLRGVNLAGQLTELLESDDSRALYNPGFTISSQEAPVWLELEGELPTDHPQDLQIILESQAGTPGLTHTIEAWNWQQNQYDTIGQEATSFNTDSVTTVSVGVNSPDYSENLTGAVRSRVGWRKTGFTINFPWEVRVDQFKWSLN